MNLDSEAALWGVNAVWILGLGLVLLFLGGTKSGKGIVGFTPRGARSAMVVGAVVTIVGFGLMAGWSLTSETASISGVEIDVALSEDTDMTPIIVDNSDNEVRWNVDFNYTGDGTFANQTQYCEVNCSLSRADMGDDDVVVKIEITDKGLVTDEGSGKTYYLINKGSDWAINWTKAGSTAGSTNTFQGESTTLKVESGGTNWVILNVTLRADALDSMEVYESEYFYVDFGGTVYSFDVRVINYLGTPPS